MAFPTFSCIELYISFHFLSAIFSEEILPVSISTKSEETPVTPLSSANDSIKASAFSARFFKPLFQDST